ncbi:MAG: hypothetical protein IJ609_01405 [Paludibacteraceae bacterium]|nr:hypothetical protein [Paludibacteraceae bacterium]MBR1480574.1 hypothetical protein [Paludibacteraceae bacterium]
METSTPSKAASVFRKILLSISLLLILALGIFGYFKFCFVYSEGTDSGELNYFSYEGLVFKTYEGKLIQSGFKSKAAAASGVQSNEFRFSVTDKQVADSLMHCTGKQVELHYQKYSGVLPWRGNSLYVVDSIWSVK